MGGRGCAGIAALVVFVAVVLGFWTWHVEYGTQKNVTFTVTGLDDQVSSSSGSISHKYLVFAAESGGQTEVFEDTDSLLHGKTDSSNVWARFMQAGKGSVWTCPVYGFRIFLFSSYRDILDGCKLDSQPAQSQSPTNTGLPSGF